MKPNFALNFTHDAIGLLHRTSRGWLEVGSAALDDPDMAEALGYLRRSALGLSPAGFSTKLVIPNSQILYLAVDAQGGDAAARKARIRAALEGRTPYAVDDLAFDWWGAGPEVQVAVVARETLAEAEAFAAQYRFNPVSFVAIPDDPGFGGEPWFGATAHAATLLQPGETVERDQDPIGIVAREMPKPLPLAAEATAGGSTKAATGNGADHAEADAPPAMVQATSPEVTLADRPSVLDATDVGPDDILPVASADTVAHPIGEPDADMVIDPAPTPAITADAASNGLSAGHRAPATPLSDRLTRAPSGPLHPIVLPDDPVDDLDPQGWHDDTPPGDVTDPRVIEPEAPVTFASRRARSPDGGGTGPEPTPLQTAIAVAARGRGRPEPEPVRGSARAAASAAPLPNRVVDEDAMPQVHTVANGPAAPRRAVPVVADPRARTAPGKSSPMADRPALQVVPLKPATDPRRETPRPASAIAGGLGSRPVAPSGRPRFLGLILTGVLLLLLAVVAAWSSFFLASGREAAPVQVVADPALETDVAAAPSVVDVPETAVGAVSPANRPAEPVATVTAPVAPSTPDEPAAPVAAARPPDAPVSAAVPQVVPPPEPEIAAPQPATPALADAPATVAPAGTRDEIVMATMDTPPTPRPVAAPPAPQAAPDAAPPTTLAPPPFGTVYAFDAAGLIVATPEGVVTPEGIALFAGKPVKVPPARPVADVVPAAIDPADVPLPLGGAEPEPAAQPVRPFAADPALAGVKPRGRPAGPAPVQDDAAAPPPSAADPRLAGTQPLTRPIEIVAAASARQQTQAASLAIAAAAAAAPAAGGSPLAVAVSARPAPRPSTFATAVESAVAAAVREAPVEEEVVAAAPPAPAAQATLRVRQPTPAEEPARVEPEADDEPEAAPVPRSINRGTVAKNATFANAINLSDINLIGVYGSSSKRYALIRQANGRYKKVSVGDRIGGGTIAAITADQVRYQKGNRMYALEMPRG